MSANANGGSSIDESISTIGNGDDSNANSQSINGQDRLNSGDESVSERNNIETGSGTERRTRCFK